MFLYRLLSIVIVTLPTPTPFTFIFTIAVDILESDTVMYIAVKPR